MHTILVDDEACVRSALRLLLEHHLGFEVIGELTEAAALPVLPGRDTHGAMPDLVVVDWELPGLDQARLLRELRRACAGVKIVALSGRPDARPGALAAGVDAFLYRGDPPDLLVEALRALSPTEKAYP